MQKLISRIRRHKWIHLQSVLVILVSLFMLGLILLSGGEPPMTAASVQGSGSSSAENTLLMNSQLSANPLEKLAATLTPTPETPVSEEQETGGIILAASLVVLVVVLGTLFSIRRRN